MNAANKRNISSELVLSTVKIETELKYEQNEMKNSELMKLYSL